MNVAAKAKITICTIVWRINVNRVVGFVGVDKKVVVMLDIFATWDSFQNKTVLKF